MVVAVGVAGRIPSRRLLHIAAAVVLIGAEMVVVVPHLSRGGAAALVDLRWGWVGAAILCEVASVATFGRLRRSLLRAGGVRIPGGRMGALAIASSAISATVPAGSAVSAGYLYRQLRRGGANAPLVAWTLAAAAVVSGLAFSVITMAGAILGGDSSLGAIAGAGGLSLVAIVVLIAGLDVVTRHPRPLVHGLRAVCSRLPLRRAEQCGGEDEVDRVVEQLSAITPRARDWGVAFLFATVNWAADLACFMLCCYAVGVDRLGVGVAVLAYVAGLATSSLTVLPGGLGTVEAGMMVGLTHAGVAAPMAVAGILTYRLIAYGLVALVGWTVWAALRRRSRRAPAVSSFLT